MTDTGGLGREETFHFSALLVKEHAILQEVCVEQITKQ